MQKHNDLYRITSEPISEKVLFAGNKFDLWHGRMGHVCNKSRCDVKAANTDIEIEKENSMSCVVFIKGKQTRKTCREDG